MIALEHAYEIREALQKQKAKIKWLSKWILPFSAASVLLAISSIFIKSMVLLIVVGVLLGVWVVAGIAYYAMYRKEVQLYKEYMEVLDREYSRRANDL